MALGYDRQFNSQELANSSTEIFEVTATGATIRNMTILLVNHTGGGVDVSGHVVRSGESADNTTIIMNTETLGSNARLEVNVPKMITGDKLFMHASAATSVTVHDLDSVVRT